jgi:dephospho-CoA kinase
MLKVGLSGNRYSGKNRIVNLFKQIGVPVFEADVILKFILSHNYELQAEIADRVGRKYFKDGLLNTEKVKTDGKFSSILDIVEPELYRTWERFIQKNNKAVYCIFHSSILFEKEWNKAMDINVTVFAPYADRIERCKFLTNKSVSSIYSLTKLEMDDLDKNNLSDFVIHNYNNDSPFYGDTLTQVNDIDKKIVDKFLKDNMTEKEFAL